MRAKNLQAVIWKEGRRYVSQCLNVDVASFGATKKKALQNLEEAVELYFEAPKMPKYQRIEQADVVSLKFLHA